MKTKTTFSQLYSFAGFRAQTRFKSGILGDTKARIVSLGRRQKKRPVQPADVPVVVSMIIGCIGCEIWLVPIIESIWNLSIVGLSVVSVTL